MSLASTFLLRQQDGPHALLRQPRVQAVGESRLSDIFKDKTETLHFGNCVAPSHRGERLRLKTLGKFGQHGGDVT